LTRTCVNAFQPKEAAGGPALSRYAPTRGGHGPLAVGHAVLLSADPVPSSMRADLIEVAAVQRPRTDQLRGSGV
jgi:hypothetical protein